MKLNKQQIEIIIDWSYGCGYNSCGDLLTKEELELRKILEDELERLK